MICWSSLLFTDHLAIMLTRSSCRSHFKIRQLMHSITVNMLLAFIAQADVQEPVMSHVGGTEDSMDKLVDRTAGKWVAGLDCTLLGKPGHLSIRPRTGPLHSAAAFRPPRLPEQPGAVPVTR